VRKPEATTATAVEDAVPLVVQAADPQQGVTRVLTPEPPPEPPPEPELEPESGPAPGLDPGPAPGNQGADRSRRPRRALVAALVAVTSVGTASAGAVTLLRDGDRPRPATPAVVAAPARVDPATMTATASSTQDSEGGTSYAAANTLDGDPATAWNSNGAARPRGRAVTLTYTFARPVELRDVVVRNGYQKVRPRPGRAPVDLYPANARVRRLRVVTDRGAWTWDLADVRAPQTFAGAAGRTGSVRLEVVSVYPSTTYPDVALSEVAFTALTPST